jgi:hypothetical protein
VLNSLRPDRLVGVGKYADKTFKWVCENDGSYVQYFYVQRQMEQLKSQVLKDLVAFALQHGYDADQRVPKPEAVVSGTQVLTRGKYAGKTFDEVKEKNGDYVLYIAERLRNNEPTTRELRQLVAYATA